LLKQPGDVFHVERPVVLSREQIGIVASDPSLPHTKIDIEFPCRTGRNGYQSILMELGFFDVESPFIGAIIRKAQPQRFPDSHPAPGQEHDGKIGGIIP
jgi:hypothetical protein